MNKDIVYIEWIDSATAPQGWSFESEAHLKAFKGVSVGYLYKEDEENVFIVPHIMDKDSKDPQLSGYMTIPKVAIIRRYNIANDDDNFIRPFPFFLIGLHLFYILFYVALCLM
jgi:hypothetical protein